jgi:hypothetical protein
VEKVMCALLFFPHLQQTNSWRDSGLHAGASGG